MWGWLEGIFEWLQEQLRPLLFGIIDNVRRFKWFVVALVAAVLAPINWALDWLLAASAFAKNQTNAMFQTVDAMRVEEASQFWQQLATASSLMNCVVPLDYALAMGTLLFAYMIPLGVFRAIIWIIMRTKFKLAGFGHG